MRDIAVGHFGAYDVGVGRERDVGRDGEGDVVGNAGVVVSEKLTGVIFPPRRPQNELRTGGQGKEKSHSHLQKDWHRASISNRLIPFHNSFLRDACAEVTWC